jgi:ribulose-phosphate 3-epimerase
LIKIAPSILAADFGHLGRDLGRIASADMVHIDVMDGRFVPNISMGQPVVAAVRKYTRLPLDVHLMIVRPEDHIEAFAQAGADGITVHVEATHHLHRLLGQIKSAGARAGVALNPATPVSAIENVLDLTDLVLVMTVNPGFGGQEFIPGSLRKVEAVAAMVRQVGRNIDVQVDGGISAATAPAVARAGANVLVAGSFVFGAKDPSEAIVSLRRAEG